MSTPQRVPPQGLDAEQAILGGILQDNGALAKAMELITEDDFYRSAQRKLFASMLTLTERGDVVDAITLTEHLKLRGELDAVGGAAYLAELAQAVPTAANIKYHCRLVRDKALLRTLLETSTEMTTRGYEEASSVDDLLDQAERSILSLMEGKTTKSFVRMKDVIKESLEHIDELAKRGNHHVTGIPTGFSKLDDLLAGLQPSDLIILAARPSMGKTSLALGMDSQKVLNNRFNAARPTNPLLSSKAIPPLLCVTFFVTVLPDAGQRQPTYRKVHSTSFSAFTSKLCGVAG